MSQRGTSVLEMVIALALALMLLSGVGAALGRMGQSLQVQTGRLEQLEVLRIGRDRVGRSMQTGGVRADGPPSDGLTLRAFRGSATWCGDGWIETGIRLPDPARDSLWWITSSGEERVLAFHSREPGGCGGAGYQWTGGPAATPGGEPAVSVPITGGVLRYFEQGRLRVDDAIRYGRLGHPAQPLTPAILTSGSRLDRGENNVIEFQAWFGGSGSVGRRWPAVPAGSRR